MRKNSARVKILFLVLLVVFLSATVLSCGKKPVETKEYSSINYAVTDATPLFGEVTNIVVFICFADESEDTIRLAFGENLYDAFEGEDDSLFDYYRDISFGKIIVHTLFPTANEELFVYKAPYARSHYYAIKEGNKSRNREESTLLKDALRAADQHFAYGEKDLDVNEDGCVDSVTFLVSGTYNSSSSTDWGGLLWPHSWELTKISSGAISTLNGVKVDRYTFNFIYASSGVLCHEFGHVLGMPDLYHYKYSTSSIPVGEWDLMHSFSNPPQYTLTYLRQKYLGVLSDKNVVDLKSGGTYSLKPVTTGTEDDVIAYRIVISDTESIWIEYRNKAVTTYDSELPDTGVIVYRVNNSVNGNENGKYHSTALPDEVFVYRPSGSTDKVNLSRACLNPASNATLGGRSYSGSYNANAIYLTNGFNTGISVTADSVGNDGAIITVDLNGFGTNEISDMYVEGTPTINYGENLNIRVKIKVKGSSSYVTADPENYRIEWDPELIGTQIATVIYSDEDNEEIRCTFRLVINDVIPVDGVAIETLPDTTEIRVGETVDLTGLSLRVRYLSQTDPIVVAYDVDMASSWQVEGVDGNKSGEYHAKITYLPFDVYVYVVFTVMSELTGIEIADKNTTTLIDAAGSMSVNVLGVSADGSKRLLTATEYELSALDRTSLYVPQTLTATAKEGDFSAQKTVYFVRSADLTDVLVSTLPKTIYYFGEALDLSAGRITFTFGDFTSTVPAENYFYLFSGDYKPTVRGGQTLLAEVFGRTISLDITLLPADENFLKSKDTSVVTVSSGYVLFKNPTSLKTAEQSFSSYLSFRFTYTDGELTYDVSSKTHEMSVNRNLKLELFNEDGRIIATYPIYVFGDGNNDGKTDKEDLESWVNALFSNVSGVDVYLDTDGDQKYTLTDFEKLVFLYGGRA